MVNSKIKIGFIPVYKEMGDIAKRIATENNDKIDLLVSDEIENNDAINEIAQKMLQNNNVEIFISRGGTAEDLKRKVHIPIVACNVTIYDILMALYQARDIGSHIGLIVRDNQFQEIQPFEKVFGIEVKQFFYNDRDGIHKALITAHETKVDVIVGGTITVKLAKKFNLPAVLIRSHEYSIRQALFKAYDIALVLRKEQTYQKQLRAVVQSANSGIIVTDAAGIITLFNHLSEKILGLNEADVVGRPITEVFPEMSRNISSNQPTFYKFMTLNGINVLVDCVPFEVEGLKRGRVITFQGAAGLQKAEQKIRRKLYTKGFIAKWNFKDIKGISKNITLAISKAKEFAQVDSTILIFGETGTGKELFAQSIHNESLRKHGPFVAVNCSALPDNLLESELFGYEEGAFTGAKKGGKPGLLELAHEGTIFLDEISGISKKLQARLLRVIEQKEVMRLGGEEIIPLNIRIIAATNQQLEKMIEKGHFRADLYYRINVLQLIIPPLRERKEDIPYLFKFFLAEYCKKLERKFVNPPDKLLEELKRKAWPGNVRQLKNYAERYVVLSKNIDNTEVLLDILEESEKSEHLPLLPNSFKQSASDITLKEIITSYELRVIMETLQNCNSYEEAAQKLGISISTLRRRIKNIRQI